MEKKIGGRLKFRRKELGMSVKDVVVALANLNIIISDKTLYGWESGHRQPDADTFVVLCQIYKIDNMLDYFSNSNRETENTFSTPMMICESEIIYNPHPESTDEALTETEIKLIQDYRKLDHRGQRTISDALERELSYLKSDNK